MTDGNRFSRTPCETAFTQWHAGLTPRFTHRYRGRLVDETGSIAMHAPSAGPAHVVLTNPIDPAVTRQLAQHLRVSVAPDTQPDTLRAAVRDAHLIIVRAPLPADVFEHGPGLLGAIRHGAGVDMIPIEAATAAGVLVANTPGANAVTVAEYAIAQMLQLARRLASIDARLRSADWLGARVQADTGTDLFGRTLGIVGMGSIGSALARIAGAGLSMRVLGHRASDAPMPQAVVRASLTQLLAESDYVVLACPLTEATRGLIGSAELAQIKHGARLVNVSRGAVIDETALIDALRSGRLAGAALDVFATQPLPADSPLRAFEQVLLTPHMAGITLDSMRRMGELALAQALEIVAGGRPRHLVNPDAWPRRRTNPFLSAS
jgi:D-3-phosphoglycerate dehydrogenase